jgi:hypothetical protein
MVSGFGRVGDRFGGEERSVRSALGGDGHWVERAYRLVITLGIYWE